ncbi:tRNA dimethylallyltransferase, mitochondrial [Sporothrix curviconia]|uniref:tRNA dimethylallyltransferase, mitochondrial n=1 Tax=Sporothrix curviconia TaxID=1260050 RepID=A0ABP0B7Y8_9PEZI
MRPTDPLIVVLGSTGTGKSDLAVELARRFNGEIINADAMQMYRGLPVTTNKISVEEQHGVPHHLLGTIGLHEPTWDVDRFRKEASQIIQEIRSRGRLPIVVGGSQYYTDGLLFDHHLVEREDDSQELDEDRRDAALDDHTKAFPILNESTETMLAELARVDPVMAARWHPKDRRKIQRSLTIFLTTGRRASDIYAEQQQRRDERDKARDEARQGQPAEGLQQKDWPCLLLWVYAKPDILNARLDARIDTMIERGLEQETSDMYNTLQEAAAKGIEVDRTRGIWQSIGFKEMEPYEVAKRAANGAEAEEHDADGETPGEEGKGERDGPDLDKLREQGLDGIKYGTRRYARYQLRWIKHQTISHLADIQALDRLYLLDSTDRAAWHRNVAETGVQLTDAFLKDGPAALPEPVDVSETAREVLTTTISASRKRLQPDRIAEEKKSCAICHVTVQTEDQWKLHMRSSRHRRVLAKHKRRALVPVPSDAAQDEALASEKPAQDVASIESVSEVDKTPASPAPAT